MLRLAALLLVCSSRVLLAANVSELARQILQAGLDVNECYRVRDLKLLKEDARIYLTDGYLIFGKKIADAPVTAIFSADVEGGDAELLLLPPSRSERQSLASFSGAPNLNEHFRTAAFVFTDDTYRAVTEQ